MSKPLQLYSSFQVIMFSRRLNCLVGVPSIQCKPMRHIQEFKVLNNSTAFKLNTDMRCCGVDICPTNDLLNASICTFSN